MGEKLLAQRMLLALRDTMGGGGKAAAATLEWAFEQRGWLWPERTFADAEKGIAGERLEWGRLGELAGAMDTHAPRPELLAGVGAAARLLQLDDFEARLLETAVALWRMPRLATLRRSLASVGVNMAAFAAVLAGADASGAAERVRRSATVTLGLLYFHAEGSGGIELAVDWRFGDALDQGLRGDEAMIETLVGAPQQANLERGDFAERAGEVDLAVRLLRGALAKGAGGVNILLHGPPGTGKTELARVLAAEAKAALYAVCEADADGEEPSRFERLHALKRAQRLLARRGDSVLLFDELEDLFADASGTAGGGRRAGSKVFVNRLFEENKVPTIWTTNALDGVDPAHLRRMSLVLRLDHPSARARARIVARAAAAEGAEKAAEGLASLAARAPEAGSVARVALRTAALAGGGAADAEAAGRSLVLGLRGTRMFPPAPEAGGLDLSLYDGGEDVAALVARFAAPDAPRDFSLLLTGPPGTGKTALAAHIAERLDRPLAVKRASDLLSKWIGGTEANIAEAFWEARENGAVLLFDEADSLLLDRAEAQHSWEITQVNELLTWMDGHPLPFVAATNFARRLDPAALRRFVFKIALQSLSQAAAARAFERFFGQAAPAALRDVAGLTPGDFAVVKRQLRYRADTRPAEIVDLLAAEAKAKPERPAKLGF